MVAKAALAQASADAASGSCSVVPGGTLVQVDGGIEPADEVRVGMTFLRDQFQDGLVIERGLLGLAQPGGAQGLQRVRSLLVTV